MEQNKQRLQLHNKSPSPPVDVRTQLLQYGEGVGDFVMVNGIDSHDHSSAGQTPV